MLHRVLQLRIMSFNPDKLKALQSKLASASQAQTGGKGSVRRKHKTVRKATVHDDKRLKSLLNKFQPRDIPGIEEVNMFKDDGTLIHFKNPKVQVCMNANAYAIAGNGENKKVEDLLPGIVNQLGPDMLGSIRDKLISGVRGNNAASLVADDDVPALVENFEATANAAAATKPEVKGAAAPAANP